MYDWAKKEKRTVEECGGPLAAWAYERSMQSRTQGSSVVEALFEAKAPDGNIRQGERQLALGSAGALGLHRFAGIHEMGDHNPVFCFLYRDRSLSLYLAYLTDLSGNTRLDGIVPLKDRHLVCCSS